ncbi:hypothetical protein J8P63_003381 [Salmonella enterica]|nr:hypothetical protein [Salmonella enterica]
MTEEDTVEGISPTDLILAADTADGKVVFDEVDSSLVDSMKEPEVEEVPEVKEEVSEEVVEVEEVKEEIVTHQAHIPAVEATPVADIFSDEAQHRRDFDTDTLYELEPTFRPSINLIGPGNGYYVCPWCSLPLNSSDCN